VHVVSARLTLSSVWSLAQSSVGARIIFVAVVFGAAIMAMRILSSLLAATYWRRVLAGAPPEQADELRRNKRQQTLLTVVESLVRYVVFGAALVLSVVVLIGGVTSVLFGTSLIVVVVGFGLQRVLGDIVSGAMLLFEGHYAVGDYVRIHQLDAVGVVEEFTLRSTVLRTLEGDRIAVLNGSVGACTRFAGGYREFLLELRARGEATEVRAAVEAVLAPAIESANQRFLLGPRIESVVPLAASQLVRVELRAVVPPTLEWLVERRLVEELQAGLGEMLHGPVDVYTISDPAFKAYRTAVLVPT
jgi:hypothetical protein